MAKEVTHPCQSASRAVVLARGQAKRRQRCLWVGLLSAEIVIVRSAETVVVVEGNIARTVLVRSGRAPLRRRTHARRYDRSLEASPLPRGKPWPPKRRLEAKGSRKNNFLVCHRRDGVVPAW